MAIDRELLQRDLDAARSRLGGVRFLLKSGITKLRIIKFDDEGTERFYRQVGNHTLAENFKAKAGLCYAHTFDEPCVACRVNELQATAGGKTPYDLQLRFHVNAIELTEERPRIAIWELPSTVWEAIATLLLSADWEDILDLRTGRALVVTRSGSGFDTKYNVQPSREEIPLKPAALEQVIDPLSKLELLGVAEQIERLGLEVDPSELFEGEEPAAEPVVGEPGAEPDSDLLESGGEPEQQAIEEKGAAPGCFGDPEYYEATAKECQNCGWQFECSEKAGAIEVPTTPPPKKKKATAPAKKTTKKKVAIPAKKTTKKPAKKTAPTQQKASALLGGLFG